MSHVSPADARAREREGTGRRSSFAHTLVGAIYDMDLDDMPELHWVFGYPMALGLMLGLVVVL